MTNLFRALRTGVLLSFCFPCFAAGQMIYVDRVDPQYVVEPLVKNDRGAAQSNTKRIAAIMQRAPQGAALFFPGGDYYFAGSAAPNRGTIESTATGQVFRGEGAGTTRIFQTDARRDFGFVCREDLKRVPAATIRIRHKGCVIDGMTVALDRQTPSKTIAGTAAIQIAHIAYHPDNNVGIIETTGRGADFLLDHVIVSRVNVGEQLGSGILSDKFFEVGIDIIGSGGHVRVSDVNRLDARTGIRLDNGNHCGQGEYQFESIYCMGNPAVFRDGVFFDWVGGQAPSIHNSSCSFTSGIFAGPRGKFGDRLNPYPEAEVVRRPGRDWDWLTLHGHSVVDDPNPAQRTEWYGLPRYAEVVRIGSEPAVGGREWVAGKDFDVVRVEGGDCDAASRIVWKGGDRPAAGSVYYVTFRQPAEYRVHDLEWGNAINVSMQEANQSDGFAVKFSDQGVGHLNPDFRFGVGYNFLFSGMFVINGDFIFDGDVDLVNITGLTSGVCNIRLQGADANRKCRRISVNNSTLNYLRLGDFTENIRSSNNFMDNVCQVLSADPQALPELIRARKYVLDGQTPVEAVPSFEK